MIYVLFNIIKLTKTNSYVLLTDSLDVDKRDLAVGRWAQYKAVHVPEFHIRMSKDDESTLFQHTFFVIGGGKRLTPDQLIEQVAEMIKICNDSLEAGKTLALYIEGL